MPRLPNTLNVSLDAVDNQLLVASLELLEVAASTSAAYGVRI
jgi:hypothetical protein